VMKDVRNASFRFTAETMEGMVLDGYVVVGRCCVSVGTNRKWRREFWRVKSGEILRLLLKVVE
jgi:hypothetical protein